MPVYGQLKKAHQDELLRGQPATVSSARPGEHAPRGRTTPVAAPARHLAAMRLRRLFS